MNWCGSKSRRLSVETTFLIHPLLPTFPSSNCNSFQVNKHNSFSNNSDEVPRSWIIPKKCSTSKLQVCFVLVMPASDHYPSKHFCSLSYSHFLVTTWFIFLWHFHKCVLKSSWQKCFCPKEHKRVTTFGPELTYRWSEFMLVKNSIPAEHDFMIQLIAIFNL